MRGVVTDLAAIPAQDPNRGIEMFGAIFGWVLFAVVILLIVVAVLSRRHRRRRVDEQAQAMIERDKEREQLQLQSLHGIPDMAPFETYATEWEWEEDLRRKTFMGYKVLELNRFPYPDGSDNEVQVQWQADPQALQRAKREVQRAQRQTAGPR